jgi:hypothetical protein
MGKGRDKRKKHEDPDKAQKRAAKQLAKIAKGESKAKDGDVDAADGTNIGGLNNEEDVALMVAKLKKLDSKRKRVEEKDVPHPGPRANSMIVKHPSRDHEIVTFGGEVWDGEKTRPFNDLLVYNLNKKQWRQMLSPGGPSARSSCQLFTYKQYVFVHGGEFVSPSQSQFLHFRDCFRIDMNTGVWDQLAAGGKSAGPCPSARSGHRIALWKRSAVLFGGFYDNALESRYYNDLWVLSDLEGEGQWTSVPMPPHVDAPHPRSGHTIAVHGNDVFVYGGFFSHRANRFQKAEATVFHDLWTISLGGEVALWQKVKLSGIPPPIRAGVGSTSKEKRMIFFGGVVDVDGPGGRTLSNFTNDLFVFHMDSKKFFPLLLKQKKAGGGGSSKRAAGAPKPAGGDLAAELAALGKDDDASSSSDDDDGTEHEEFAPADKAAALCPASLATLEEPKSSEIRLPTGQVVPCPRMNAMMTVVDHQLVVFGGQYEAGKKEVTLCDLYTLNLNRNDTFECHYSQDLTKVEWKGQPSEASGSWEDGSTVMSAGSIPADSEEDDDDENSSNDGAAAGGSDGEDDEGAAPAAGSKLARAVLAQAAAADCDARTNIQGKAGLKKHKAQLEQQLSASNAVPAPFDVDESAAAFFERTKMFWLNQAAEVRGLDASDPKVAADRKVRKQAIEFAKMRHGEAIALMRQLTEIEEQQRVEAEALKAHFAAKRAARAAAAAEDEEEEEEATDAPEAVPV